MFDDAFIAQEFYEENKDVHAEQPRRITLCRSVEEATKVFNAVFGC